MSSLDSANNDAIFTSHTGEMMTEYMQEPEAPITDAERIRMLEKMFGLLFRAVGELRTELHDHIRRQETDVMTAEAYYDARLDALEDRVVRSDLIH